MGNQQVGFFTIYHSAVDGPEYDYNPNYNQVYQSKMLIQLSWNLKYAIIIQPQSENNCSKL
jgi:hypothetical protein